MQKRVLDELVKDLELLSGESAVMAIVGG